MIQQSNSADYITGVSKKFFQLWKLVGNTPMIAIRYKMEGKVHTIYAKCEHYNLTGSIKDRMALYILEKAYAHGDIFPGNRIVEATSGNTGISFSAIGKAFGHPVTIIMPDWLSKERTEIIKSLGADIIHVGKKDGGFPGSIALAEEMAWDDPGIFLPKQFQNLYNSEAHQKTTGPEIWSQLESTGLRPDAFVAGVGTGGTVMGVGHYLKKKNPYIKIHPLEPAESPTLSTGFKIGSHRIQGISDDFIPAIVHLSKLDEIVAVSDGDAILMAQKMAATLGLAVGISSGANIAGAIKVKAQMGEDAMVVTVLPDSNKKYLSTALTVAEPMRNDYVSCQTTLLDYTPIQRAYETV